MYCLQGVRLCYALPYWIGPRQEVESSGHIRCWVHGECTLGGYVMSEQLVPTAAELPRAPCQSSTITRPNYKHGVAQQVGSLGGLQLTSKREATGVTIRTARCATTHFIYASFLAAELAVCAVLEPRQHLQSEPAQLPGRPTFVLWIA